MWKVILAVQINDIIIPLTNLCQRIRHLCHTLNTANAFFSKCVQNGPLCC